MTERVTDGVAAQIKVRTLEAENKRLRAELEDACQVFDHYDLPEHAFHYRRKVLNLEPVK